MRKYIPLLAMALSLNAYADSNGFYIEGLLGSRINKLDSSKDYAGASGYIAAGPTGRMGDVRTDSKITYGAKLGYKLSENIKFDLSYYNLSYGTTKWGVDFTSFNDTYNSAVARPFIGNLSSQTIFASAYYSMPLSNGFSPYIGAGVGPSFNKFKAADEGGYNLVAARTTTSFAYKLDIGVGYEVNKKIGLDFGISLMNVGNFSSGNHRNNNELIAPYKFDSGLSPIANIGLIYKL